MNAWSAYAPLWCKSNFSFLEGASHPEELVEEAHRLGMTAVALTDRDGVYGVVEAHQKARELQGKAAGALNEAAAKVETVAADIKQRAVELQTQAHVVLEEGQKQIAKAMEETKKAATATLDSAVEKPKEIPAKA